MRLYIEGPTGAMFDFNEEDEFALAPTDKEDRAQVLSVLVSALGVIAGITQQSSFAAKEVAPDQLIQASSQYLDGQKFGTVLHLVKRMGVEA